ARSRVNPHVEWTVSHQTEPALRVFELPGRNTQIKKRAADCANSQLVENAICMSEIRLPYDDAPAKMRQMLGHVPDCIRILVQSQNIGASFQKRFSVPAAATRSVENQQPGFRRDEVKDFPVQHRPMIDKLLGRLRWLVWCFGVEREPRRRRSPERVDDVLTQHAITSRAPLLHAGK